MIANASLNAAISVFSIAANVMIITAFCKTKSIQNVTNIFLVQLAFTDLIKATLILPIKVYNQLADVKGYDNWYCQLSGMIITITTVMAALLLAVIALVRYVKVVKWKTFDRAFSVRKSIYYSLVMYVAVFVLAVLPVLGVGRFSFSIFHGACFASWAPHNVIFRSIFYLYSVGFSYPVLVFCYWKLFAFIRSHKRRILPRKRGMVENGREAIKTQSTQKSEGGEPTLVIVNTKYAATLEEAKESSCIKSIYVLPHQSDITENCGGKTQSSGGNMLADIEVVEGKRGKKAASRKSKVMHQDIRVTRVLFVGVITYTICWLPATLTTIFTLAKVMKPSPVHLHIIVTMVEIKLFINPLVYGIMNKQFRGAIKNLFP